MKKSIFVIFMFAVLVGAGPSAHAQSACGLFNNFSCPSGQQCAGGNELTNGTCQSAPQTNTGPSPSGYVPLSPIPGLTSGLEPTEGGLAAFLNNLYKYLVGIAAILALIEIIWGGLEISTQDSVSKNTDGKQRIYNALFGLLLVLSPALVFSIINPSILNLSLNLPPLDTKSGGIGSGGGSSTGPTQTTLPGGVTQNITGTYMQTAQFSSVDADANNAALDGWLGSCRSSGGVAVLKQSSSCSSKTKSSTTQADTCNVSSDAIGLCGKFSSSAFTFVNLGTKYSLSPPSLKPLSASAAGVSSFVAACRSDGGTVCISQRASDAEGAPITFQKLDACPETITGLPGDASGACYSGSLYCSSGPTRQCAAASFAP